MQVGNRAFAARFKLECPNSWAVVNQQDPVPRVPGTGGFGGCASGAFLFARLVASEQPAHHCTVCPEAEPLEYHPVHNALTALPAVRFRHACCPVRIEARGDIIVRPSFFERSVVARWAPFGMFNIGGCRAAKMCLHGRGEDLVAAWCGTSDLQMQCTSTTTPLPRSGGVPGQRTYDGALRAFS